MQGGVGEAFRSDSQALGSTVRTGGEAIPPPFIGFLSYSACIRNDVFVI